MGWLNALRAPAVEEHRWVVLDVETSGLDPAGARLLAVAAIGLAVDWDQRSLAIAMGDSFEVVVRQEQPSSRENILLHGIGVARQAAGEAPRAALQAFERFARDCPLLAFHAAFDRALVDRYARSELGGAPANPWLDIEHLCGVTHPEVPARSLDEWLQHFGIPCTARHQAAADTLAACELLLRIWPRVAPECRSWRDVRRLAARHRWMRRA